MKKRHLKAELIISCILIINSASILAPGMEILQDQEIQELSQQEEMETTKSDENTTGNVVDFGQGIIGGQDQQNNPHEVSGLPGKEQREEDHSVNNKENNSKATSKNNVKKKNNEETSEVSTENDLKTRFDEKFPQIKKVFNEDDEKNSSFTVPEQKNKAESNNSRKVVGEADINTMDGDKEIDEDKIIGINRVKGQNIAVRKDEVAEEAKAGEDTKTEEEVMRQDIVIEKKGIKSDKGKRSLYIYLLFAGIISALLIREYRARC